ncbi:MAG: SelL-related redox protein [Pirellulales bacterium]
MLTAAGVYNITWGIFVVLAPGALFHWTEIEPPHYPAIWQCVGMIVGVCGVGYLFAAADTFRYWPIVLVGLLGKVLGPIGFVIAATRGELPWSWGATIVTNDLIWWLPFTAILYQTYRRQIDSDRFASRTNDELRRIIDTAASQQGETIATLSRSTPLLLLFLRHSGCTFCRQALADVARRREALEAAGIRLALVHMGSEVDAAATFPAYGLGELPRFSDPECRLYRAFGLERGRWSQIWGPRVWWPGLVSLLSGNGIGPLHGDVFRMPGAFLIQDGAIVHAFRHETSADRPDYGAFIRAARNAAPVH